MFVFSSIGFCVGAISRVIWDRIPRCEYCQAMFDLDKEDSRTMYCWNGEGEDPNRPVLLCKQCAKMHHEYWDDMWSDYYGSRI